MSNLEILPKVCLQRRVAESYNKGFADGLKFAKEMREPLEVKSEDIPEDIIQKVIESVWEDHTEFAVPLGNPWELQRVEKEVEALDLPKTLAEVFSEELDMGKYWRGSPRPSCRSLCEDQASWEEYYADE